MMEVNLTSRLGPLASEDGPVQSVAVLGVPADTAARPSRAVTELAGLLGRTPVAMFLNALYFRSSHDS